MYDFLDILRVMLYCVDNFKFGRSSLLNVGFEPLARYIKVTGQLRTARIPVFTLHNTNSGNPVKVLLGIAWPGAAMNI